MEQFEHTIIFETGIDPNTVQDLINRMSSANFVNLYFSTDGGYMADMNILIDYLNYRYQIGTLRLYVDKYVCSAGTLLLLNYVGPIFISKGFYGFMFHMPYIDNFHDIGFLKPKDPVYKKGEQRILQLRNNSYVNNLKGLGLTTKQIKDINENKEVYIFVDEIHKLKKTFFTGVEEEVTQHYTTFKF